MSAVEVTITGLLYDKINRTTQNVVLIGEATLTGLGVGGGPMPPGQGGGGSPPGIWGPTDPRPTPPIAFPPGWVGGVPPGIGGGPIVPPDGEPPHPAHPIVLPPDVPPTEPPTQPPDVHWVWGWNRAQGWHPVYVPQEGEPGPKAAE